MSDKIMGCKIVKEKGKHFIYAMKWGGYHYLIGEYDPKLVTCDVCEFLFLTVQQARELYRRKYKLHVIEIDI